jgi:hypothetical protein
VASQQDWLSADVKVYQTYVSIDEPLEGLRPDMSAEVSIVTDAHRDNVLTIPVQCILGSSEPGDNRRVFVSTPQGPVEREITLGLSNDKMVEVKSGLEEGEQVALNPRVLLSDKDKAAAQPPPQKKGGPGEGGYPGGGKGGGPGAGGEGKKGPWPGAGAGGEDKKGWPGGGDKKGRWGGKKGAWNKDGAPAGDEGP